jgi:ribosome-associated protein
VDGTRRRLSHAEEVPRLRSSRVRVHVSTPPPEPRSLPIRKSTTPTITALPGTGAKRPAARRAPGRPAATAKAAARAPNPVLTLIETSLDADKAEEIVTIDLTSKTAIADYMVIATGRSQRQLAAMADHLVVKLKHRGLVPVPVEGKDQGDWVLIDAGDVIVHLFRPEARVHYNLEKMWAMDLPEPERAAAGA